MPLDLENFTEVRIKGEILYKNLSEIYCPYFKDKIHFNAHGLEHLKFKRTRKARPQQDQYMRFRLIHLVPLVIESSHTLQGILETKNFERVRVHSRTDTVLKNVKYFEFIAVVDNVRVRIIIKKIEEGQLFFWSIIPYWGINKNNTKRKLHSGYPEED